MQAQLQALAQQIMEQGQAIDSIAAGFPPAAQEVAQIKQLLKQILVKAASLGPMTTSSAEMTPTGSSMGAGPY